MLAGIWFALFASVAVWTSFAAEKPLKIGFGHVPPITFRDSAGAPQGFAVDVLNEAAQRAGISLAWTRAGTSREIERALESGRLDLVPAGMVSAQRKAEFFVSEPWWFSELSLLTRADAGVTSESDLRGKRLGLSSPILQSLARRTYPGAILVPYDSSAESASICSGAVDGMLLTHGDVHEFLAARPPACRGVDLVSFETKAVMELAIIARPEQAAAALRLRSAIDGLALEGRLATLAAEHPPVPASGAMRLAETLRARYRQRMFLTVVASLVVLLALSVLLISVQLGAHRKLSHQRELLQRLINTIPVMIAIQDARSGRCTVNKEFERLLGSAAGRLPLAVCHLPASGWQDLDLPATDGALLHTSWAKAVLSDGTGVAIGIDVTQRRLAEAAIREAHRLEAVGILAGGVAHDFNNILTVIAGNISVVLGEPGIGESAGAALNSALEASARAAGLTRQLLAYAGKGAAVLKPLSVSDVARETIALLRPSIPPQVQLRSELARDLVPVLMDPNQLQQVFANLISNAAEAIAEGRSGTVTVRTAAEPGGIAIEVVDDGCGMDEATRTRIFDPFFSTKFTGRGLGMAAVQGILRTLGGSITVSSAVGVGTSVRVLLPVPDQEAAVTPPPADAPTRGNGVVLIVDDEPAIRKMSAAILRKHGIPVYEAATAKEAIEHCRQLGSILRVLLLDLTMPEGNGDAALATIAALNPDLHIIVSSGRGDQEVRRHFAGNGVHQFLAKPYSGADLLARVLPALNPGETLQRN